MITKVLFLLSYLLIIPNVYGETLSGIIYDSGNREALYSVSVTLIKNTRSTYSEDDGRFIFTGVNPGPDTLVCRLIGYRELRYAVTVPGFVEVELEPEPVELDVIETRLKRPDDLPPHERTTASVNMITKDAIPGRKATVAEILDSQVGIDVRSLGGIGAKSEVSIRGSTAEQVTVYVDGIPVTAEGSGVSGLSAVPINHIESIEVYRGASPGIFGSGAIGGVINISTIEPGEVFNTSLSTSYGSFSANHQTLMTQFGIGRKNRMAFSIGRHASENDFRYYDNRGTLTNTTDDGWETRKNNDYAAEYFLGSWQYELNPEHSLTSKISINKADKGVSGLGRRPALNAGLSTDNYLFQSKYEFDNRLDILAWMSRQNRNFYDPEDEAGRRGPQDSRSEIDVLGIIPRYKHIYGPALFNLQLELKNERFSSSDEYYSSVTLPSERLYGGGGIESEIMLAGGKAWIHPRLHYAHIRDELQDASTFLVGLYSDSTMSVSRDILTLSLGGRYTVKPSVTVRFNAGYYSRTPEFNELFGDTGDIVGNPRLKEELSRNIDAGIHYSGDRLPVDVDMDVTCFYRYATDLIQRLNFGDYLLSENIGKAEVTGIESLISGHFLGNTLHASTSLAYQKALNKSDETVFRKKRYYNKLLPYHPSWQSDTVVRYTINGLIGTAWKISYESDCYKGSSNLAEEVIEARIIHDLDLSFAAGRNISINLEIENAGNEQASDRWGYPKPGRAYFVSLKWNYERGESQ